MNCINVNYLNQKDNRGYAYLVPDYLVLEKGDLVVVEARDSYSLARVINFNGSLQYATKYVVSKVDVDRLEEFKDGI